MKAEAYGPLDEDLVDLSLVITGMSMGRHMANGYSRQLPNDAIHLMIQRQEIGDLPLADEMKQVFG